MNAATRSISGKCRLPTIATFTPRIVRCPIRQLVILKGAAIRLWRMLVCAALFSACGSNPAGGAFRDIPTPPPASAAPPAQLDLHALSALRDNLTRALGGHLGAPRPELSWGPGPAYALGGPYRETQGSVDQALALAAASVQATPAVGAGTLVAAGSASSPRPRSSSAASTGPRAGRTCCFAEGQPPGSAEKPQCPPPAGAAAAECLLVNISDGLLAAWYAKDTKAFFHTGDTTTVYRPVEAFAVGCALVVAGFREHNFDKIDAGQAIVRKEMKSDLDQHYGMVYSLMTASPAGSRAATDYSTRVADQAGIAQLLVQAFNISREQEYLQDAATLLQPLTEQNVSLRSHGYLSGFDLRGSGPDQPGVDVEAGLLVLWAAHGFDHDDGNRFARLEENAAAAVLDSVASVDPGAGLPAAVKAGAPSARSGLVTALGIVALGDVAAPGAGPSRLFR